MTPYKRTYRIDKLYHQFLKPKGLGYNRLLDLLDGLTRADFIEVDASTARYTENDKMTDGKHRKELFDIVRRLK